MINNPFLSNIFSAIWTSFFIKDSKTIEFKFLPNLLFYKKALYYINVGRNLTNGISYSINNKYASSFGNRVLLVYDVPSFFKITNDHTQIAVKKINQYKGFLCDLRNHESFDLFLKSQFKSNSRYKFKRNLERLEHSFNIEYSIFFGEIEKQIYDKLMQSFKKLIDKRFIALKKYNDVVANWDYYEALVYPMILEKKALLQSIKKDDDYIGISLSFINGDIVHFAITSFDSDYKRYNLGHTNIIKLIEWCFENKISVFDFSKGENEYKLRWTNREYVYENHILFNSKKMASKFTASILTLFFKLKQFLRDIKVNTLLVKGKYLILNLFSSIDENRQVIITEMSSDEIYLLNDLVFVSPTEYDKLKPIVYDRLYRHPESEKGLIVYKDIKRFYVLGNKDSYALEFN